MSQAVELSVAETMTDRVELIIDLTPELRQQIEELARLRGYPAPGDYLLALVESDVQTHGGLPTPIPDDVDVDDPVVIFREAWHDAMAGQVRPIEELWDELNDR